MNRLKTLQLYLIKLLTKLYSNVNIFIKQSMFVNFPWQNLSYFFGTKFDKQLVGFVLLLKSYIRRYAFAKK